MALLILTMGIANPVVASIDEDEEEYESQCGILNEEHFDPVNCEYPRSDCAQIYLPSYDYSRFQSCTGDIGWLNPGP